MLSAVLTGILKVAIFAAIIVAGVFSGKKLKDARAEKTEA